MTARLRSGVVIGAIAAAALACSCGGGGQSGGGASGPSGPRPEPAGPSDPAAMRALLAQYSPSGHAVVTAYEALPEKYQLAEGERSISTSAAFDTYFRDGNVENIVQYT